MSIGTIIRLAVLALLILFLVTPETFAPLFANRRANARPTPEVPPEITTISAMPPIDAKALPSRYEKIFASNSVIRSAPPTTPTNSAASCHGASARAGKAAALSQSVWG